MFSTFPGSMPGVGLLMLRLLVGLSVIVQVAIYSSAHLQSTRWGTVAVLVGSLCGIFLLVGFLTPVISVIVCLVSIASLVWELMPQPFLISKVNVSAVCTILVALALIFLGPGAFSVDARLFGRREIIIGNRRSNS